MSAAAERVMYDASFQSACQRYANSGGSSAAIAAAAIRVLEADPKLLAELLAGVSRHCDDCGYSTTEGDVTVCPDQRCRGSVG